MQHVVTYYTKSGNSKHETFQTHFLSYIYVLNIIFWEAEIRLRFQMQTNQIVINWLIRVNQ